jgi:predicted RNA binding protein YcfA (HicA-like mRNA interferase family)
LNSPKLHSSAANVKALEGEGFKLVSQKGSHAKYRREGPPKLTVIVPAARKLGTFRSILRQSGLDEAIFNR